VASRSKLLLLASPDDMSFVPVTNITTAGSTKLPNRNCMHNLPGVQRRPEDGIMAFKHNVCDAQYSFPPVDKN